MDRIGGVELCGFVNAPVGRGRKFLPTILNKAMLLPVAAREGWLRVREANKHEETRR